jgi:hypothetical protein
LRFRDNVEGLNDSLWGKTSPPYIYEGTRSIEAIPIETKILFTLLSLCPTFPTLIFVPLLSQWRSMAF